MINSRVIQALEPLNVPVYWMEYDGSDTDYIVFQTNNQSNIRYYDDITNTEKIDIGLIYWFKTDTGIEKIDLIKDLMLKNGFIKLNEKDMKIDDFYGRSFRFKFIESL